MIQLKKCPYSDEYINYMKLKKCEHNKSFKKLLKIPVTT